MGVAPGTTAAVIEITQTASSELLQDVGVGVDAVGAEEGAVLDRVRTDSERVRHGLAAVRVHGQGQPGGVRLLHCDGEFGSSELGLVRSDGGGHVAAAGHHLITSTPLATRSRTA